MILLEVVEAERLKVAASQAVSNDVPTRSHPEDAQPSTSPSPRLPDYATSQAQAEQLQQLQQQEEEDVKESAKLGRRRLGRAIVYALAIYFILSISIAVPLFLLLYGHPHAKPPYSQSRVMSSEGGLPPSNLLPPDVSNLPSVYGTPIECNNWTHINASKHLHDSLYSLHYWIPSNETIYLRSNFSEMEDEIISAVTGSLHVSVTSDTLQRDAAVYVVMKDIGEEALRGANVCLMRTDTGWGLAIYVPDDASEDNYYFDVDLRLPLPSGSPQLTGLATYLPSFNQTFEQLDSYMNLESFTVQGSLGSINIESVHAQSILVKASAADITGTFNASDKVILETILAPVTANVSLYNEGNNQKLPTLLNVETGNSDIALNVTLYSNSNGSIHCPPIFVSSLKTFSGALEAAYRHHSSMPSSSLFVRATNSLEPALVFVDSKFEGTYDVHTTLADAIVDRTTDLVDPTGANRRRTFVDDHVSTNRAYGWVGWGTRPTDNFKFRNRQGHIEVVSSLNAAVLQLTEVPDASRLVSKASKAVFAQR